MTALINFTRLLACVLFCPNAHASGVVSVTMSPPRVVCKQFEFWHASNVNCVFRRKEDIDVEQHQARLLFPVPRSADHWSGRRRLGGTLGERGAFFNFSFSFYSVFLLCFLSCSSCRSDKISRPGTNSLGVESTLLRMTISYRRVPARRAS